MIQKLIILLGISAIIMTSCQQDEHDIAFNIDGVDDNVPVTFSFSMNTAIENGTEYVPMSAKTRDGATPVKLEVSNTYNYIIIQKIDTRLIVETVGKGLIDPNVHAGNRATIHDGGVYESLSVELRPGDYEILLFTGNRSVNWNDDIKRGDVLSDKDKPDLPVPYACRYKISTFWANNGREFIDEEIFFGRQPFTVQKTEDLHSSPNTHAVTVPLKRRVTKFRVLFKDVPSDGGLMFADGIPIFIRVAIDVRKTDNTDFASGLDVWGNLWYDPEKPLKNLQYIVCTASVPKVASDGVKYYITRNNTTLYAPYFFCDPDTEIPITTSYVDGTVRDTAPRYIYEEEHEFVLKWNSIDGLIFKPTDMTKDINDRYPAFVMETVLDGNGELADVVELFDSNYEYNYTD